MKQASVRQTDFRKYIRRAFEERHANNPGYSIRAFARDLGMTPGSISSILSGRQGLSSTKAKRFAKVLGLNRAEQEEFIDMVESACARSVLVKSEAKKKIEHRMGVQEAQKHVLSWDAVKVMSDWYHYAILELTHTKDFRADMGWISKRLGISIVLVTEAFQRLLDLGYLVEKNGKFKDSVPVFSTPNGIPSASIRNLHRQILNRAQDAIVRQSVEERDFSVNIVAIDPELIPDAKQKILEFRRSFAKWLREQSKTAPLVEKEVYAFNAGFFSLTEKIEGSNI